MYVMYNNTGRYSLYDSIDDNGPVIGEAGRAISATAAATAAAAAHLCGRGTECNE